MDQWSEKDAERGEQEQEQQIAPSLDQQSVGITDTDPDRIEQILEPSNFDELDQATSLKRQSLTYGTDREKHLSAELERDQYKRESVETSNYRFSQITANTGTSVGWGDDPEKKSEEGESGDQVPPLREGDALQRPTHTRAAHSQATTVGLSSRRSLPSLRRRETKLAQKEAHPWQHLGITLGGPMIILFDLVVPCIVYYSWYDAHLRSRNRRCRNEHPNEDPCPIPRLQYNSDILGYAIICFGFGELWILLSRVHRLYYHRDECAPLLSRHRWELDATSWVYAVAMILALIPFVIGSELELQHLYLYSPCFIMGFLGLLMFVTTCFSFTLPIGINSQARGTKLRPFIYYAAEDFIAVDGMQDREFRVRYNERYETNRQFRRFFVVLTIWWMCGVVIYIGCVSAVIWKCEFHTAFGLSLGVLFSYIAIWAGTSAIMVHYEMKREHLAYENGEIEA
ncbi:hypothetical protein TI39_contig415g00004 [Zymoseptoria brevis]|uniref:Uncharacterized protein n=1 Tax=Zymoseptoria brevis TaxID=1047168 RepID=A0A0F4GMQ6_9PEZI|nr:hypothetical protein TI39_contig415g00004 [Zymoseptoria brevis]